MNHTSLLTKRARHGLRAHRNLIVLTASMSMSLSGLAFALPTQESTATPPSKTAPGAPPAAAAPAPETAAPPARNPAERPGRDPRGRPTAPTATSLPPSPADILSERDVASPPSAQPLTARSAAKAEKIVRELHKANELEVTLASLAANRSASDAVKTYARDLVDMHQSADKKVLGYAQSRGIAVGSAGLPGVVGDASARPTPGGSAMPAPAGSVTGQVNPNRVASAGTSAVHAGGPNAASGTSAAGHGTGLPSPSETAVIAGNPMRARDLDRTVPGAVDATALPAPTLDAAGRRLLAKLEKLEGPAFDKQFLSAMVQDHAKVLAKVKSFGSDKTLDTELATVLRETQTMVEEHLTRAKALQHGGTSATPGQPRALGAL